MEQLLAFLQDLDWSPLWISLKTGVVATIVCFFLGIFAARQVLRLGPRARPLWMGF